MQKFNTKYETLIRRTSDINEHLPTLYMLAKECTSIVDCGVRFDLISTWALAKGLLEHDEKSEKKLVVNGLEAFNTDEFMAAASQFPELSVSQVWMNDLDIQIDVPVDMVFIDTWHVYGHLKRELAKFAPITKKYIVMHDTTIDEVFGETIREKLNASQQAASSGFPLHEILCGLGKAIDEFLRDHPEWKVKVKYVNCHGLTVLERVSQ